MLLIVLLAAVVGVLLVFALWFDRRQRRAGGRRFDPQADPRGEADAHGVPHNPSNLFPF